MNNSLVIRLSQLTLIPESELDWFLFDPSQQLISSDTTPLRSIVDQLPGDCKQSLTVHIIVPNDSVLLARVDIPSRNRRQIKQALPFAIEELITEELENVHMALPSDFDASHDLIDVAIIKHSYLIQWLDSLYHHQLTPHTMVVDTLCVPCVEGQSSVLVNSPHAQLRLGLYHGVSCELSTFDKDYPHFIEHLKTHPALDVIYCGDMQSDEHQITIDGATDLHYKESVSEILATTLIKQGPSTINLLQGGYKQGEQEAGIVATWRNFFIATAASLLLFITTQIITGWYFNNQADQVRVESVTYYKSLFPNERRVVSPKRQLQNHLRLISTGDGATFLSTLAAISPEFKPYTKNGEVTVNQLAYSQDSSQLRLELTSKTIEQLDQLKQQLSAIGVKAAIGSARVQDDGVISNMTVEGM